ncbi:MAG: alpha/beta hydrolase [Spirochaetales bacterium]|nr:MAG: alpha/beta hydrolase [Spirochaetales bacterium]
MSRILFEHRNKIKPSWKGEAYDMPPRNGFYWGRYAHRVRVLGFAALILMVTACQSSLVFHPERRIVTTPEAAGMHHDEVSFTAADGVPLAGWWVPGDPGRDTVLFCHGNAGNISYLLETIRILRSVGLNVFVFDYRGFGASGGEPSEKGTYRDVEAAWRYLIEGRRMDPGNIIVMGRSLGGSIAAYCAMKYAPRALIVESAFSSMSDAAKNFCSCTPVSALVLRYRYDTVAHVARVKCPVLIIHSRYDEVIPFSHALKIFEAAAQPKDLLEIRGDHNGGFLLSEKGYKSGIVMFLIKHGAGRE